MEKDCNGNNALHNVLCGAGNKHDQYTSDRKEKSVRKINQNSRARKIEAMNVKHCEQN